MIIKWSLSILQLKSSHLRWYQMYAPELAVHDELDRYRY